ncbi:helix-turn-helix domain-containing protein [Pseudomonas brassicacearum]|uniref:AraC family transcriptional regulator n=1 Tax=Pseudomonas brassicacearum TaxID=930166 RepID=A0A423G8Y2_9PSED|nr:helix-turn-helix domain-containing protein [Pseudomonas brassicacearum]ROM82829.1 AraC family transcriptional regulator [Pseudomonas brassicacearum]RON42388.1 AraC family transcriptional regulator [Pseudomonas brassicacearum]
MVNSNDLLHWIDSDLSLMDKLFDRMPDLMFYVKDTLGRYVVVNQTLVRYSGKRSKQDVIGLTADDLFPITSSSIVAQDLGVIHTRKEIIDALRLFRSADGQRQWCLSSKFGILDSNDQATGLVGISRILARPDEKHLGYKRLMEFSRLVKENLGQPQLIADIAKEVDLSMDTLQRLTREVFQLSPKQILMKARIEKACDMLEHSETSITGIATECGYSDHSAFSRQFKATLHCTPQQYRSTTTKNTEQESLASAL